MNALIAVVYGAVALILLLVSMEISSNPALYNPLGVLVFFCTGHIRLDELFAERPCDDALQP